MGMPSPSIFMRDWSLMTCPAGTVYVSTRLSKCVKVSVKPQSACARLMCFTTRRSAPCRWKTSCSRCSMTKMMSPGAMPGCSLPSPRITILSPDFMPFSTKTSRTLRFFTSFLAPQARHLSCSRITVPSPLQSGHGVRICWIMGPIWRTRITTPRPLQVPQVVTAPSLRAPVPLHSPHRRSRVIARRDVLLLYRSSRLTRRVCFMGGTCLGPESRRPPPPKNWPKRSSAPPPPAWP
mmetsp:Transcript_43894/g.137947  ORF Transcript_43894/g.137947 Transcript_43894/m.137947 type:complete len:236 (+) Transcript_43894:730-1437(+)